LQIMREAGYETSGMIAFFGRVQQASRNYNDTAPAYLRSHPLTTERIADIQSRTRDQRYKQRADSLDFHLIRARLRVLQDSSPQGLRDAAMAFDNQLRMNNTMQTAAAKYGLAFIALRQGATAKAQALLQEAGAAAGNAKNATLAGLGIDIRLEANQPAEALKEAEAARAQFPLSRAIAWQYADALMAARRDDDAVRYLRDQTQQYRQEPQLHDRLAKAYAALGKQALQHLALAESYATAGNLMPALDQLGIARRAPDATYYDQAVIDARERELRARWMEEVNEQKNR
jgi:predicted Zn-dependent protease